MKRSEIEREEMSGECSCHATPPLSNQIFSGNIRHTGIKIVTGNAKDG